MFSTTQDFGPGGIGGAWCGAPDTNETDQGWKVIGGGAQLSDADVTAGVNVAAEWPDTSDTVNPGWSVRLNAPANVDPGDVQVYAVCIR